MCCCMILMRQPVHDLLRGLRIGEKKNTGRKTDGYGEKKIATAFLAVVWLAADAEGEGGGGGGKPSIPVRLV